MTTYFAPTRDMRFVIEELAGLDQLTRLPGYEDATPDLVEAVLDEAAKLANEVLAPLNKTGDAQGVRLEAGGVLAADGFKAAYQQFVEGGWNGISGAPDHGGQGLPELVLTATMEMWNAANMSFALCPLLNAGATEALKQHGSDALKTQYLPNMVSGAWTGTMNLTEPQAGSDLSAVRTKAVPEADHYRLYGQKIFITWGDHDLTDNVVHLVLARTPDAPEGVKGISLFLVPKFLVNADGSLGQRNDVQCVSIEHKLGIHASPTCTLSFGDNGGAIGYLVGEPHKGLQYMFAMMNSARLGVGLQGIGIAEHALQHAVAYAMERKQGGTIEPDVTAIMGHPDIRRMLGLMKSRTEAARVLAYRAARSLDFAHRSTDAEERARHQRRVDLLIPVVKGWSTELGVHSASLGVQVHGGMGYIEETGAAQHLRDARITTIYEGTTGIQALDLIGRKIIRDSGLAASELVADMRASAAALAVTTGPGADWQALGAQVSDAADAVETVAQWLVAQNGHEPLAAAVNVLELFGIALGAWAMGDSALFAARRIAAGQGSAHLESKLNVVAFYMANVLPMAQALQAVSVGGAASVLNLNASDFGAVA